MPQTWIEVTTTALLVYTMKGNIGIRDQSAVNNETEDNGRRLGGDPL
jgi:hypothetical protein